MSDEARRSEVRVSDQDPEMLAIKAIGSAFANLDTDACTRVLKWADERYGYGKLHTNSLQLSESINEHLKAMSRGLKMFEETGRALNLKAPAMVLEIAINRLYQEALVEIEAQKAHALETAV